MKQNFNKYFTLILAICTFLSCSRDDDNSIANDSFLAIPDASFEAILIAQGIDSDGIVNQQLLKSDAETVTELNLNKFDFGKIHNVKGIHGFVSLTKLIVNQHNINEINLSANTLLETVFLAGNSLSTIDISKNINIETLDLTANELTEMVGLPKLNKLKDLDLSFNYLDEITVSNASLEVLHISNNDLTSLDLSSVPNLKNLLLTSNKIHHLELLSNKKLETLLVSDNQLENINLSKNNNLTHLYITSNQLNSLDISNNFNIIDLKVDRNPSLNCIKIANGQDIQNKSLSDYQELNVLCN